MTIHAEFYGDRTEAGKDIELVRIKIVGDPNDLIKKVTADHVKRFPREYEAYKLGSRRIDHGGTKLADVPGVDRDTETKLNFQGVHNAEQLAGLSDGQVSSLGIGTQTLRRAAQLLLAANKAESKGKKDAA